MTFYGLLKGCGMSVTPKGTSTDQDGYNGTAFMNVAFLVSKKSPVQNLVDEEEEEELQHKNGKIHMAIAQSKIDIFICFDV